jgi:Flp pilus assembly protein TadB
MSTRLPVLRRFARCAVVASLVAALAVPATAAAGSLVAVRKVAQQGPVQQWLVAATGQPLQPNQVQVFENGTLLNQITVRPSHQGLSLAVIIDDSASMHGPKVTQALAAARALVASAPSNVQIGVYALDSALRPLASFGTSPAQQLTSMQQYAADQHFHTVGGSRIYDGVNQVLANLHAQATPSKMILLISDGGDVGSTATLAQVASTAGLAGVHIFPIGLAGPGFNPSALTQLAAETGGTFTTVGAVNTLGPIEQALTHSLTNLYVVSFRSNLTAPGASAQAQITAPGYSSAAVDYGLPLTPVVAEAPGFWHSTTAHAAVVAIAGLAVFALALLLLRPKKITIAERVAEYHMTQKTREARESVFLDDLLDATEMRLRDVAWARRLELELDRAQIAVRASQVALAGVAGALIAGIGFALLFRNVIGMVFGLFVPVIIWMVIRMKARRRMRDFEDQLPDNLAVLAQSLRAGFSLSQALASVAENASEPSRGEFRRVVAQTRLGGSIEAAMDELGIRMASKDFAWVVAVVSIQTRVGGNMAEILDSVASTILERQRLRRHVRALTAQGRMTQWVLTALPIGVGFLIYLMDPGLMNEMLKRPLGLLILGCAGAAVALGSWMMSRIVKIEI